MKTLLTSAAILGLAATAQASPASDAWNAVLADHVAAPDAQGVARFDYAGLDASDRAALNAYIDELARQGEPEGDPQATAYWANLYNAVTVRFIADAYPVKSIRKLGAFGSGPWKKDAVTVDGQDLSLDDIEHGILRKRYPSPLIHYMVNCASVGCPNLMDRTWEAETLDTDREAAARAFVNSPRGVTVDGDEATVSSIYKWFDEDFGGSEASVIAHLRTYADPDLADALAGVDDLDYEYDWDLNQ